MDSAVACGPVRDQPRTGPGETAGRVNGCSIPGCWRCALFAARLYLDHCIERATDTLDAEACLSKALELAARAYSALAATPMHESGSGASGSVADAQGSTSRSSVQASTSPSVETDSSRQLPPLSTTAAQHASVTSDSHCASVNPAPGSHCSHRVQTPTATPEHASRTLTPGSPPHATTAKESNIHRID